MEFPPFFCFFAEANKYAVALLLNVNKFHLKKVQDVKLIICCYFLLGSTVEQCEFFGNASTH